MTYEEFRDIQYRWNCGDCKFCKCNADVESVCKRLDHKHFCFSKPVFHSYHCGSDNGTICSDYEPKEYLKWLNDNWNPDFINDYIASIKPTDTICLCLDSNFEIRYRVRKIDFVTNNFIDNNGNLKWVTKEYYKRSNSTPIGYMYCVEYQDGHITYGANKPIEWERIK